MRTRKLFRKFHRWIGIFASLWLLILASTGLLLQHSHDWKLDKKFIQSPFVLESYGIGKQFIFFNQGQHQLIQLDHQIIQDKQISIKLTTPLKSAIFNNSHWIVATEKQILWLNQQGQIVQTIDELDGLAIPIESMGIKNQQIYINSNDQIFNLNSLKPATVPATEIQWSKGINDAKLKLLTLNNFHVDYLSYQQVIFDIHAAITTPSLLNDLAAIALILLSLSGILLFFKKKKTIRQDI